VPLKKGIKALIADAEQRCEGIDPAAAQARMADTDTVFVDIRDVRELERDGMIPGAFHAPRRMLEFWVDPESAYQEPVFLEGKTFILYWAADWRASLAAAALTEMGLANVVHLPGGFSDWKKAGRPVGARPHKRMG
jgi:rhodanese-related sulfurtransferase